MRAFLENLWVRSPSGHPAIAISPSGGPGLSSWVVESSRSQKIEDWSMSSPDQFQIQ